VTNTDDVINQMTSSPARRLRRLRRLRRQNDVKAAREPQNRLRNGPRTAQGKDPSRLGDAGGTGAEAAKLASK